MDVDFHNNSSGASDAHLLAFVERIERLHEERAALAADLKEVYAEVKDAGFDTKILKALVSWRASDKAVLDERDALLELYRTAVARAESERGVGSS